MNTLTATVICGSPPWCEYTTMQTPILVMHNATEKEVNDKVEDLRKLPEYEGYSFETYEVPYIVNLGIQLEGT